MLVDGDEALERLRDPADSGALQPREGDHAICDDDPVADEKKLAVACLRRIHTGVEHDPAFVEQVSNSATRLTSEEPERLVLGRGETDRHAGDSLRGDPGGGHQRKLVGG